MFPQLVRAQKCVRRELYQVETFGLQRVLLLVKQLLIGLLGYGSIRSGFWFPVPATPKAHDTMITNAHL